jgi:hypothetical protein
MPKISVPVNSVDVTINVFLQDATSATGNGLTGLAWNTASLSPAVFCRPGQAPAGFVLALQTPTGAWTLGGFCAMDNVNYPGLYRLDLPNIFGANAFSGQLADQTLQICLFGAENLVTTNIEIEISGGFRVIPTPGLT